MSNTTASTVVLLATLISLQDIFQSSMVKGFTCIHFVYQDVDQVVDLLRIVSGCIHVGPQQFQKNAKLVDI